MNRLHRRLHISAESIAEYASSIEAPFQRINGLLIAPAGMPIIFWKAAEIPWLPADCILIHGSQQFWYEAPITAGMTLDCELSLSKMEHKMGRQSRLTLYTHKLICKCDGSLIVTAETVLIGVGDEA